MMITDKIKLAVRQSTTLRALLYPAITIKRYGLRYRKSIKDEVLDNLREILSEDPVIMVNEFMGNFIVGSQSDTFRRIAATKEYEPELAQACVRHLAPDRDAIDIGSNIGFYTVLLAKVLNNRRVLSIEPTPNALTRLRKNIQLNGVQDRVLIFGGVASDHLGYAELNVVPGREEYSSLGSMTHPSITGAKYDIVKVPSTTVDNLTTENGLDPGFVKMDVEGMEHVVLNGMRDILKYKKPVILSELSDPLLKRNGSSSEDVINFITGYGYHVTDPIDERLQPGKRTYGDILCIPIA